MSRKSLDDLKRRRKRQRLNVLLREDLHDVEHDNRVNLGAEDANIQALCADRGEDVDSVNEQRTPEGGNGAGRELLLNDEDVDGMRGRESPTTSEDTEESDRENEVYIREYDEEPQDMRNELRNEEGNESDEREEQNEFPNSDEEHAGDIGNDEGSEQSENEEIIDEDRILYQGAPLTVGESMLLLLTLMLNHNLSMVCMADIITVINLHCLAQGLKKNSLPAFQRYFALDKSNTIKHFYCPTCWRELQSADSKCPSCPNKKNSYFIELPFIEQLKEMYQRTNFYNSLQWRFQRPPRHDDSVADIYDGCLYRDWVDEGFLANPDNISFSWYTDGIPVFKSSKIGAWPLYLTVNELPFEHRKKMENTLLAGLWFGDSKPDANTFIHSFRAQFQRISRGVNMRLPDGNQRTVKGVLLTGTCDLPAKATFLNFIQFNGGNGCPACYVTGRSEPTENGQVFIYPYDEQLEMRTLEEWETDVASAQPDHPVRGVKGTTAFSKIMPDFIRGMAIDRMHGVEGGVVRKILTLLFAVKYSHLPFSLCAVKDIINARLIAIKPPKFVHRMPRSVDDLIHWKASELKIWFFHYSIPVLEGVMRIDYFENYLLLVQAITLLNGDNITMGMMIIANDFLQKFVKNFQDLYGLQFCSLNIHQLLHLPRMVLELGPLWVYSCFQYEDLNGQFLKLVHGTWHIDTQIGKKHEKIISMPRFIEKLPPGNIRDFCLKKKRQVKLIENIFPQTYSVGTYKKLIQIPDSIRRALRNGGYFRHAQLFQYFRLLKKNKLYVAKFYPRTLQTDSHIVKYIDVDGEWTLGALHSFVKFSPHCDCLGVCRCHPIHLAIINRIITDDLFYVRSEKYVYHTGSLLRKCHITDNLTAIPIGSLETVCVHMIVDHQMYVGIPVNEKDVE